MSKPTLIVLMGVPASGKSYQAESLPMYEGTKFVCPDEIREELTGDRGRQDKNNEVFALAHERTNNHLQMGVDVVFDATNVRAQDRATLLQIASNADALTNLVVIRTPYEVAKERNRARIRHQVPDHIMDLMHERFVRSLSEVGYEKWDNIYNVWS